MHSLFGCCPCHWDAIMGHKPRKLVPDRPHGLEHCELTHCWNVSSGLTAAFVLRQQARPREKGVIIA